MKRAVMIGLMVIIAFTTSPTIHAGAVCTGHFVNPITDICWDCLFPLTIGSAPIVPSTMPDTDNPKFPICLCGNPIPRPGVSFGYWEPFALVDVTRQPFCMVNIGGIQISTDMNVDDVGGASGHTDDTEHTAWYNVHWYKYPLMGWLSLITDVACLEAGDMDIGYLSELDPTWQDDSLTLVLNPEAILFGNPIAQLACVADSLKTTTGIGMPINSLFWCFGSQGSAYPLDGSISAQVSPMQGATLEAERMTYKLHRELVIWDTIGVDGPALCQENPSPIIPKDRYRYQLVNLIPNALVGYPFGTDTMIWEWGHMPLLAAENSGFLIWRKRNCCVL